MASSDTSPYEPGFFEIIAGVFLSLILGVLLACIFLISRPVEKVREIPNEPKAGVHYYVEGNANSASGRLWQSKRQHFVDKVAGEIILIEDEINSWVRGSVQVDKAEAHGEASMMPKLDLGLPNFRLRNNLLQIGYEGELQVYGTENKLIVQMIGDVQPSGDGFAFAPEQVWVGGLEVSKIPGAGKFVSGRLLSSLVLPAELTGAWDAVSYAKVEGNQLVLRMP